MNRIYRKLILAILIITILSGCDKPIITIDLKGQPDIPAPPRYELKHTDVGLFMLDTEQGRIWKYNSFQLAKAGSWISSEVVSQENQSSGNSPQDLREWIELLDKLMQIEQKNGNQTKN